MLQPLQGWAGRPAQAARCCQEAPGLSWKQMVSRLGQISQAVTRSLKGRECAGAVVFMALGTVLRVCCAEPNPQGRVLGPAECDLTRLAILEARRLESWILRSSTGTQPRGKSRARVTSLQMVSLLPHAATAKTPSLEGLVRLGDPVGVTQHIVLDEGCALQPYEALVIETQRLHLSKSRVLH